MMELIEMPYRRISLARDGAKQRAKCRDIIIERNQAEASLRGMKQRLPVTGARSNFKKITHIRQDSQKYIPRTLRKTLRKPWTEPPKVDAALKRAALELSRRNLSENAMVDVGASSNLHRGEIDIRKLVPGVSCGIRGS